MHTVADILREKGSDIWSIGPDETILSALQIMAEKRIGALLVMDNGKLTGIVSERDYARKVILKGKSSRETTVGELMTPEVFYAAPEDTLEESMALMTAKRIRHMPVLKDEQLIGMVTLGDVVKQIISEQQFTIKELEKYISGGYEI